MLKARCAEAIGVCTIPSLNCGDSKDCLFFIGGGEVCRFFVGEKARCVKVRFSLHETKL